MTESKFPVVKTAEEAIKFLERGQSVGLDASSAPSEATKLQDYWYEQMRRRRSRGRGVTVVRVNREAR